MNSTPTSSATPLTTSNPTWTSARHRLRPLIVGTLAIASIASACGVDDGSVEDEIDTAITEASTFIDEAAREATEFAARNFVAIQGEEEFGDVGHGLVGGLECEADASDSMTSIEITCVGETDEGGAAQLHGTSDEYPGSSFTELEGEFVGTVDDEEVFRVVTLG